MSQRFYRNRFIIGKFVLLRLYSGMINESAGISREARKGNANVLVYFSNLFYALRLLLN